jgi:hypothetical protein
MAWPPDTINSAYKWSKVANIAPFWRAVSQRSEAAGYSTFPTPIAGSYVNSANASAPTSTADRFGIRFLQSRLETIVISYRNETITIGANAPTPFGLATWRSQASINSAGFRRKCPRQISSTTATVDTEGNTIANGMYAMGSPTAPVTTIRWKLYVRTAGAWTLATSGKPDLLDSASAVPNRAPYGLLKENDYVGSWVWLEMKAGIDLLNAVIASITLSAGDTYAGASDVFPISLGSWAAAKSQAESRFARTGNAAGAENMRSSGSMDSPSTYVASIGCVTRTPTASVPGTLASTVKLYVKAIKHAGGANSTFDNNGLPYTVDTFALADTKSRAASGPTTVAMADLASTSMPTWCAAPTSSTFLNQGFVVNSFGAVIEPTFTDTP